METLPIVEQAVVCNDPSTITGFIISPINAVIYWALKEVHSILQPVCHGDLWIYVTTVIILSLTTLLLKESDDHQHLQLF